MVEYLLPAGKDVRPPSSSGTQWTFANADLLITAITSRQHRIVDAIRHISLVRYHRVFPTEASYESHWWGELPPLYDNDLLPPASRPTAQHLPRSPRRTCPQENSEPLQTYLCA